MIWLIVNADDFGITCGVNKGIIEAHCNGILTSASLMVDRPAAGEAAALARRYPSLSLGLHLELDAVEPSRVPAELKRQGTRFLDLVGARPTHIDSHHDTHRAQSVLPSVLHLGRRLGVPVRGHSAVHHVPQFYGRWDGMPHLEQISPVGLLRVLDAEIRSGVNELSCHPGYGAGGLSSSYAAEREVELQTLCDATVRWGIRNRRIGLIGFHDLPVRASDRFLEGAAT